MSQVLILGTGAVGAFYGSRLATVSGTQVSCVCRSNYKAVKENGITVDSPDYGKYHFVPHRTFSTSKEAIESGIKFDYIVITTKALPDISDDSELAIGLVSLNTSIVLIQNGVGVEHPWRDRFSEAPILSAVTVVSAAQTSHGVIKHNRWTRISIGPYNGPNAPKSLIENSTAYNHKFVSLLKAGGVKDAEEYDERGLQFVRWHKLAINASMNPSSVLSGGVGNARMCLDPELRLHLTGIINEIFAIAPIVLGAPWPEKLIKIDAERILKSTERNVGGLPSMLLDYQAGRPLEMQVILGNPIKMAREKGAEMPRLQTVYALLRMAVHERDAKAKL